MGLRCKKIDIFVSIYIEVISQNSESSIEAVGS